MFLRLLNLRPSQLTPSTLGNGSNPTICRADQKYCRCGHPLFCCDMEEDCLPDGTCGHIYWECPVPCRPGRKCFRGSCVTADATTFFPCACGQCPPGEFCKGNHCEKWLLCDIMPCSPSEQCLGGSCCPKDSVCGDTCCSNPDKPLCVNSDKGLCCPKGWTESGFGGCCPPWAFC